MDHQSFRYYIPGIIFLSPIYFVSCWIITNHYNNPDLRQFVLIGGITVFPAISLPLGWFIYNIYRVIWLKITHGGYENKEFNTLINNNTKPFYCPINKCIFMDLTNIYKGETWLKFRIETFRNTFYPFTSKSNFYKEIQKKGIKPKFTEHLSDNIQFKDSSYDYARSVSSVRYGLESAVFALLLGSIYSSCISAIWLHLLNHRIYYNLIVLSIIFIIILTIVLIFILYVRWYYASKEYDARLNLISLINTQKEFDIKSFENRIPDIILDTVKDLDFEQYNFAAFDLDNTLLKGDIGDAVFAELLKRNKIEGFTWSDYCQLLEIDRKRAYVKVINSMKGLKYKDIENITMDLINSTESFVDIENNKILIPKPNPIMQDIITYLRTVNIDIVVITASNQISAQLICWHFFGIPSSHVYGGQVSVDWIGSINKLINEIPFGQEKVNILKSKIKNRPIITGGDGIWDKYLLDYTDDNGLRLWLGKNPEEYLNLKNSFYKDSDFFHVS